MLNSPFIFGFLLTSIVTILAEAPDCSKFQKRSVNERGVLTSAAGSVGNLGAIDYSKSGKEVAWDIAKAVVPTIGAGLALIPVIGPLASGIFLSLWALFSPIFAPKPGNPLEKMITELAQQLNKRIDDTLSSFLKRTMYGEISRNYYVCKKYTEQSKEFSEQLACNKPLAPNDALALRMYLDNCDNFLKDTAEEFTKFSEYADVLWIPGAITTLTRLGFLTELYRTGHLMGIKKDFKLMYLEEIKNDTSRQFGFFHQAIEKIRKDKHATRSLYDENADYLKDVSTVEKAACTMQGQFYYFDPDLYPHGMPTVFNNTDMFTNVSIQADQLVKSGDKNVKHVQYFFNVTKSNFTNNLPPNKNGYLVLELMNCFLGPMLLNAPNTYWFSFHTIPSPPETYSYEFRVIFLHIDFREYEESIPVLTEINKKLPTFYEYINVLKKVYPNYDEYQARGRTTLNIEFLFPTDIDSQDKVKASKQLISMPGHTRWKTCPTRFDEMKDEFIYCNTANNAFKGTFKMYSAGIFNHNDELVNPVISIAQPLQRHKNHASPPNPAGYLLGMEIIVGPYKR